MGWVGFQKSYVILKVGHGKCLRPITRWVGGVKKGQNHAYVIFEWSLRAVHKSEKRFLCNLCDFATYYSHSLKKHQKSHETNPSFQGKGNIKKNKCSLCEYTGKCPSQLYHHVKAKSLYISCAVNNFYGTEIEIWAGFGPVGSTLGRL